ncbi:PREDICTED: uncharacterized protein LOC104803513 [Tarenaya hassleriana]|uniref:uncharacterized protein LOC104803513 n=1 Tax=Tarenaya hassleriana TaxID=28532 RepID=UPI00053C8FEA|nr:PREDICTED: uncharacterized protein LOC104803513 [Tarenaya hassleriana]
MGSSAFLNALMELSGILNESCKLFLKNRKLMFFVMVLPLFLNSAVYLINFFSIKAEVTNLILESSLLSTTDPNTLEYSALLMRIFSDIRLFVGSAYIFLVVHFIVSLFFSVAVVRASALTHAGKNVQFRTFLVLTVKSWKQLLVTYFYITLFVLGYLFLFLITLLPVLLFSPGFSYLKARGIVVWIIFAVFESYLAIVWQLSVVISILEETYGIQALGKAARIAKGMKPSLFLVNLSVGILSLGLGQCIRLSNGTYPSTGNVLIGLVVVNSLFLVNMFRLVVYTVSYFHCKSVHGEEVELQGYVEYTKIPSELLVGNNV